jgi:hypothetical protein
MPIHTEFFSHSFSSILSHFVSLRSLQNKRALLETKIARAQDKKRGMWSLGSERISAADHKRGVTTSKKAVAATSSRSSGSAARGGAQETGRSSSKQANQGRGSNALESVMTGLEFVG